MIYNLGISTRIQIQKIQIPKFLNYGNNNNRRMHQLRGMLRRMS
jgi:hypothetical protein